MPPGVATLVFAAGILGLLWLDRDPEPRVSLAVWIPVAWMTIAGSRMVSEWLQPPTEQLPSQYLEGSSLDRLVLTGLLVAAVVVLLCRWQRTAALLAANTPILLFLFYCAVSVLWSDYPDVAFKRWTKASGDLAMVMVVLSEPDPTAAVKQLMARVAFLLIPISVLLVKYYPDLGRGYNPWTWTSYYVGVATGKNGLGYVCLVCGLGSVWRFLGALRGRNADHTTKPLIAHSVILAMVLWLFWKADSVTSLLCFLVGATLLMATTRPGVARTPASVHLLVASLAGLLVSLAVLNTTGGGLVQAVGRDMTLTGRTELWDLLLRMRVDPLFGTGFESFWLGGRVERIWATYWWHPTQAHNGYLEIFLSLGAFGVALLALVMAWGYWRIAESFKQFPELGSLKLSFFSVAALYNLTEGAFRGFHIVWIAFLLAVVEVPALLNREHE